MLRVQSAQSDKKGITAMKTELNDWLVGLVLIKMKREKENENNVCLVMLVISLQQQIQALVRNVL